MAGLRLPMLKARFDNANGLALNGGLIYTYAAGTNTPLTTYSDAALTTPNTNPVVLNSRGEANIFLAPGKSYKVVVRDSLGNLEDTQDFVTGSSPAGADGWIDVKNYGAAGTGSVDDKAAIQAAANAATTSPRRTLFMGAGTYRMDSGVSFNGRIAIIGDGMNNTVINYTPVTGKAFSWSADGTYSYFKGIKLYNNDNTRTIGNTAVGFETFTGSAAVLYVWDQCWIEGFQLWGIDMNDSFNCAFLNGRLRRNGVQATIAGGGTDGQGGGMRLRRLTFTGAATTGNDYSNSYITGNNWGIQIEPSGSNNKAFNTRFDNCIFEENWIGCDLRNMGTGGKGRYQFLNTCYFEANVHAGAYLDEGTTIACYQNNTTVASGTSTDGPDGIVFTGRYVEDRPSRWRVGNNSAAPYDGTQAIAFAIDKGELTNYISTAVFNEVSGVTFTPGAGTATTNRISITAGSGNPEGVKTANSGSLFLRRDGTGISSLLYVKTSDASNTGWLTLGALQGPTASRPTADATNKGVHYYDTDILRTVVSNGAGVWREYNGLSTVRDTYANIPTGITGARFYASDLNTTFQFDGSRWRQLNLFMTFVSVTNGGTTTVPSRGGHIVGSTTGAAVATHTLTLPSGSNAVSGDRVRFTVSNGITTLAVSSGATVVNAPTTMTAGQTVEFAYNDGATTWYRVA